MIPTIDTTLNERQHNALDRLGHKRPEPQVIGWTVTRGRFMPIVRVIHYHPMPVALHYAIDGRGALRPT